MSPDGPAPEPSPARPRVVLVDDIAALRVALPALLPGLDFVAVHADAESFLAERPVADLALLDLKLSNASQPDAAQGLELVQLVVAAGYRVCLYSQEERRFVLAACIAAGASGLVSKSDPVDVVAATVARVLAGEVVLPDGLAGLAETLVRRGNLRLLSPRQRELLAGRARGKTYAEIAGELYLSESTLRGYWADLSAVVAEHLQSTSAADIEQAMGLAPGDLLWPRTAPGRRP
ncbi:two-component system, NarL family, response regulator DesR [Microlunatus sagamiharensis]|uniref:Two-component system, NarL family, response regulator DesR n=1 Tax=Microlunatus sagamiharensis TaxID=546874 RepID=A0A1H2MMG8_9ACTN|nr:two-component system, NarL family, response regulator DesR [Microlunatus sagamiharensis]